MKYTLETPGASRAKAVAARIRQEVSAAVRHREEAVHRRPGRHRAQLPCHPRRARRSSFAPSIPISAEEHCTALLISSLFVLAIYITGSVASYVQVRTMGGVGRRVLFHLRNALFLKLQELPVAFFNQNKAGDLISRLNNDTDKLNQFVVSGADAVCGQRVPDNRRGHLPGQPECQTRPCGADARARRPAADSRNLRLDEAQEPGKPAGARRDELGSAGKPEQFQSDRGF